MTRYLEQFLAFVRTNTTLLGVAVIAAFLPLTVYHFVDRIAMWPALEKFLISVDIEMHEQSYLSKLRDTHLGCQTLRYRMPDILFVGDSHTYAGYDFLMLQQSLPRRKVGSCALSGMFPENLADLLDEAQKSALLPTQVVFGIQPRMFWDVTERDDRISRAKLEISKLNTPRERLTTLFNKNYRSIERFIGVGSKLPSIDKQVSILEAMNDQQFDRFLADEKSNQLHPLIFWRDAVAQAIPFKRNSEVIDRICASVKRTHVKLGIVYIPESRWLNETYSEQQIAEFRLVAEKFKKCADWVDLSFLDQSGGPNKWYANRYLLDDYPYEAWSYPDAAEAWIKTAEIERRWQFFDPDHLNGYGAKIFTGHMILKHGQWMGSVNGDVKQKQ